MKIYKQRQLNKYTSWNRFDSITWKNVYALAIKNIVHTSSAISTRRHQASSSRIECDI